MRFAATTSAAGGFLAAASSMAAKRIQIPARLVHCKEPGSAGYVPPTIR
jgi:hypothetical protein